MWSWMWSSPPLLVQRVLKSTGIAILSHCKFHPNPPFPDKFRWVRGRWERIGVCPFPYFTLGTFSAWICTSAFGAVLAVYIIRKKKIDSVPSLVSDGHRLLSRRADWRHWSLSDTDSCLGVLTGVIGLWGTQTPV